MKLETIGIFEAKTHLSEIIDHVEQGDRYILTRNGKPVAELCPLKSVTEKRKRGIARDRTFWMADDFNAPLDDFKDYM